MRQDATVDELLNSTNEDIEDPENVNDENVNEFILKCSALLVKKGMTAIDFTQQMLSTAEDSSDVDILTKLMKSTNDALNTMTKISLQNKKGKLAKELRASMPKKELPRPSVNIENLNAPQNTIITRATREEFLKQLEDNPDDYMDAEVINEDDE
jgi:hypothetical protein